MRAQEKPHLLPTNNSLGHVSVPATEHVCLLLSANVFPFKAPPPVLSFITNLFDKVHFDKLPRHAISAHLPLAKPPGL